MQLYTSETSISKHQAKVHFYGKNKFFYSPPIFISVSTISSKITTVFGLHSLQSSVSYEHYSMSVVLTERFINNLTVNTTSFTDLLHCTGIFKV